MVISFYGPEAAPAPLADLSFGAVEGGEKRTDQGLQTLSKRSGLAYQEGKALRRTQGRLTTAALIRPAASSDHPETDKETGQRRVRHPDQKVITNVYRRYHHPLPAFPAAVRSAVCFPGVRIKEGLQGAAACSLAADMFGTRSRHSAIRGNAVSDGNGDYVYSEATREWRPASKIAADKGKARKTATPPSMFSPMATPLC